MGNFLRSAAVVIIIVSTVVLQVLLTRYFPRLLLDLPLVAVLYLTMAKESLLWTILSGTVVGFLQDSLSPGPFGTQRLYENRNRVPGIHDEHHYRR
jgi:rod shape-determining protein MreD